MRNFKQAFDKENNEKDKYHFLRYWSKCAKYILMSPPPRHALQYFPALKHEQKFGIDTSHIDFKQICELSNSIICS